MPGDYLVDGVCFLTGTNERVLLAWQGHKAGVILRLPNSSEWIGGSSKRGDVQGIKPSGPDRSDFSLDKLGIVAT